MTYGVQTVKRGMEGGNIQQTHIQTEDYARLVTGADGGRCTAEADARTGTVPVPEVSSSSMPMASARELRSDVAKRRWCETGTNAANDSRRSNS